MDLLLLHTTSEHYTSTSVHPLFQEAVELSQSEYISAYTPQLENSITSHKTKVSHPISTTILLYNKCDECSSSISVFCHRCLRHKKRSIDVVNLLRATILFLQNCTYRIHFNIHHHKNLWYLFLLFTKSNTILLSCLNMFISFMIIFHWTRSYSHVWRRR